MAACRRHARALEHSFQLSQQKHASREKFPKTPLTDNTLGESIGGSVSVIFSYSSCAEQMPDHCGNITFKGKLATKILFVSFKRGLKTINASLLQKFLYLFYFGRYAYLNQRTVRHLGLFLPLLTMFW